MTLLYKLFGIPRNLEEFLDREKKRGEDSLKIGVSEICLGDCGAQDVEYGYSLYIQSSDGKRRKRVLLYTENYNELKKQGKKLAGRVTASGFNVEDISCFGLLDNQAA